MRIIRSRSGLWAVIGRVALGVALVATVACRGDRSAEEGATALSERPALNYEVTPERYDQWVAAQRALDAIPGLPQPPRIDPMQLDEAQVQRAVQYLERDNRARSALARAGISARDYVLTTIALDQALVTAEAGGEVTPGAAVPASGGAPTAGGEAPGSPRSRTAAGSTLPAARTTRQRPVTRAGQATPPRPRLTGTPRQNVELVTRKRDDVVQVLRTMRFRISEPAAAEVAVGDTTVTRTDSVAVGKGVTVKWDVTVRRNRDTSGTRKAAPRDTTPPDSTERQY